jgi:hypothetical protein
MLVNKIKIGLVVFAGLMLLIQCKEKKTTTQEISDPTRSDYIATASYIYVTACDSASKQLSRIVLDTNQFTMPYSKDFKKRLDHLLAGGKNLEYHRIQNSLRYVIYQSVRDLNLKTALYMSITEYDDPLDYINRNIMVKRYLEPNRENIKELILKNTEDHIKRTILQDWENMKYQYSYDYPKDKSEPSLISEEIADQLSYKYMDQTQMVEDSIKKYYHIWDNPAASTTMVFIQKNK